MTPEDTTVVAGIPIPSTSPIFLTVVGLHVLVGLVCVVAGAIAMLSPKRSGRHPTFGTIYYWSLVGRFRIGDRAVRGSLGRRLSPVHSRAAGPRRRLPRGAPPGGGAGASWVRLHITGMGLSYAGFALAISSALTGRSSSAAVPTPGLLDSTKDAAEGLQKRTGHRPSTGRGRCPFRYPS